MEPAPMNSTDWTTVAACSLLILLAIYKAIRSRSQPVVATRTRRTSTVLIATLVLAATVFLLLQFRDKSTEREKSRIQYLAALETKNSTQEAALRSNAVEIEALRTNLQQLEPARASLVEISAAADGLRAENAALQQQLAQRTMEVAQLTSLSESRANEIADARRRLEEVNLNFAEIKRQLEAASIRQTPAGDLLFDSAVLFGPLEHAITCDKYTAMAPVLAFVVHTLVTEPGSRFKVVGHTDNTWRGVPESEIAERNQKLSEMRATAVVEYLRSAGIRSELLSAVGMGMTQPAGTTAPQEPRVIREANLKTEDRARNRRVEIKVERPGQSTR